MPLNKFPHARRFAAQQHARYNAARRQAIAPAPADTFAAWASQRFPGVGGRAFEPGCRSDVAAIAGHAMSAAASSPSPRDARRRTALGIISFAFVQADAFRGPRRQRNRPAFSHHHRTAEAFLQNAGGRDGARYARLDPRCRAIAAFTGLQNARARRFALPGLRSRALDILTRAGIPIKRAPCIASRAFQMKYAL